jgi:hypothetical protein
MLPEYPEFKSLEIEDLDQIRSHLKRINPKICEWALANQMIWKDFDHPLLTMINKNLCIYITPPNEPPYFLEPTNTHKISETIEICLKHAGKISRTSEDFISNLSLQKYRIKCLRNQFDYIYETKVLAGLKGRKFDGKRNHLKNFRRRHPAYEYIPLKSGHKKECLELFKDWFSARAESRYFPKLAHISQKAALENAFAYYDKLDLAGGALLIDKKIKGFILGSPLSRETVSIHFQYGHPALRGIFQTLLWEACEKTFSAFKYVNLEQDLGIPGLRKAKLSYHPLWLEKKFEIKPLAT